MRHLLGSITAFIVGSSIFAGIPALCWAPADLERLVDHPVRLAYLVIIVALQIPAALLVPRTARRATQGPAGQARHRVDLVLIQVLSLAIVGIAPLTDRLGLAPLPSGEPLRCVGLGLVVAGFVLMVVAERQLGEMFSVSVTLQEDHRLVTSGAYRHVRHPRYLGIMMLFVGIALVFRSLPALVLGLALGAVLAWRVTAEEVMMAEALGQEWQTYCSRSWRLVPFVY